MKPPHASALRQAFLSHSPRHTGARNSWQAALIHLGLLVLWIVLLREAFTQRSMVMAWSLGIVYVSYDTLLLAFVASQTWRLWWPQPSSPPPIAAHAATKASPRIGVIVAAHNEAQVLPVTLRALMQQTDRPDRILIADDGSHDGTAPLLESQWGLSAPQQGAASSDSSLHTGLTWLKLPHGGKARALNAALQTLDTDIVLTVDADTLLAPGAIAAVRRAFAADANLVAATGIITPVCSKDWSGRVFQWFQTYEYIRNFLSRYAWARFNSLLLVSGAFACFRRDAVLAVGGFDDDCLVEDYELMHRLHRHARDQGLPWRVGVLGDAQAQTDAPGTAGTFLRQRRRWFGGFLQTQYWYRDMVANPRMGALGLMMLPVKALDTLQPVYGLTAFVLLLAFLATGQLQLAGTVFGVMAVKVLIDLVYHLWSIALYRRWVNDPRRASLPHAFFTSLLEPLSFQLLRHVGAVLGWWTVLTGSGHWAHNAHRGLSEHHNAAESCDEEGESGLRAG